MTTSVRALGYLAQATLVSARTPVYTGVIECSACPDWRFESRDVTSCGAAYTQHWVAEHAAGSQ